MGGAGDEGEDAAELTRRQFGRVVAKVGVAASAAIWVAPHVSSVALAEGTAGSPPPPPPTSAAGPTATQPGGDRFDPGRAGAPSGTPVGGGGAGTPGGAAPGGGGELAFTGSDVRALAATGGAAVVAGSALIAAERLAEKRKPRPATGAKGSGDETGR